MDTYSFLHSWIRDLMEYLIVSVKVVWLVSAWSFKKSTYKNFVSPQKYILG